jgi:hypothetical protein
VILRVFLLLEPYKKILIKGQEGLSTLIELNRDKYL